MAKQSFHVLALTAALVAALVAAGVSHAAPQWGRYGQPGAEHRIPGAHPDNRGGMPQPGGTQYGGPEQDNARRAVGRMSPEQRRDLRRQINEAGQDIYPAPRR